MYVIPNILGVYDALTSYQGQHCHKNCFFLTETTKFSLLIIALVIWVMVHFSVELSV